MVFILAESIVELKIKCRLHCIPEESCELLDLETNHSGNLADGLEVKYGLTVMKNFEK